MISGAHYNIGLTHLDLFALDDSSQHREKCQNYIHHLAFTNHNNSARTSFLEALEASRSPAVNDKNGAARALISLGEMAVEDKDLDGAFGHFQVCVEHLICLFIDLVML